MFIAYQRIEPTTRLRVVAAAFDRWKRAGVFADSGTVFDELLRGILGGPAAVFALLRRRDEGATMFSTSVSRNWRNCREAGIMACHDENNTARQDAGIMSCCIQCMFASVAHIGNPLDKISFPT